MLVTLGRPRPPDDLVELLAACHERIHRFLEMAHRLAGATGAAEAEIAATAGQVRRYFAESLPQHIADEDLVVAPHLAGRTPALDAALAAMSTDHVEHADAVARLVAVAAALESEPQQIAALATELGAASAALRGLLVPHLTLEERTIFPALRALPEAEQQALRAAMRERRTDALAVPRTASSRRGNARPGAVTES